MMRHPSGACKLCPPGSEFVNGKCICVISHYWDDGKWGCIPKCSSEL